MVNEGTPVVWVVSGDRVMAILVGGAIIVMAVDGWVGAVVGLAVGGEDIGADVGVSVGDVGNPPKMKARLAMFELAPPLSEQVQQTKPAQPLVHCLAMSLGFAVVEKLAAGNGADDGTASVSMADSDKLSVPVVVGSVVGDGIDDTVSATVGEAAGSWNGADIRTINTTSFNTQQAFCLV